ncbi:hypothetical protein [Guptibacillus algicola]|uniref:hypothetical protein n=1 Tax=Guptibacillus algicola TaxID=225844 RepID=UPI001CD700BA|nr:hypothetical protein [Alkalihalobacillus algicola]MCA0987328.1 hypothetical protein [Alkalihalobacillus algicola]
MRNVVRQAIYFVVTLFIFLFLWRVVGWLWELYVPFNYKTDFIGLLFVLPVMVGCSFLLASLMVRVFSDKG